MHLLHRALNDDRRLREIAEDLSKRTAHNPLKHGLVLDLNPFWRAAYRLTEAGLSENALIDFWFRRLPFDPGILPSGNGGILDLSREFRVSEALTARFFGRSSGSPFLLRIFALAVPTSEGEWSEYRAQLVEAARNTALPTIVEAQEPARLLSAPGDRVHSATRVPGTLGGFLRDGLHGPTYAVTCGHVVAEGPTSSPSGYLGICKYAAVPRPLPGGVHCSASCEFMTKLDVALIDVQGAAASNVAKSVAQIVSPGEIVTMKGASSSGSYEIGGVMVDHAIGGCCWERLFLFHAPVTTGLLHPAVKVAMTSPPADGDSGAWLMRNKGEWTGMVVAGNALFGWALASTHILTTANDVFKTNLKLA